MAKVKNREKPKIYPPDSQDKQFLEGVTGYVEATREEHHQLWNYYHNQHGFKWESGRQGIGRTIGFIRNDSNMPVFITIFCSEVGGEKIAFVEATSRFVDREMVRMWMEAALPESAKRSDGRWNHTDATNFCNILTKREKVANG